MTPTTRRPEPSQVKVPADLAGPVDVALAKSEEQIPEPHALPGGSRYEVKMGRLPSLNSSTAAAPNTISLVRCVTTALPT